MLEDLNTVHDLKREIERLREGEEDRGNPNVRTTPGQLLKRIHETEPKKRLKMLENFLEAANGGSLCLMEGHKDELARQAGNLQIMAERSRAWQTSHRLLTVWAGALTRNRGAVLTSEHVADKLTLFLAVNSPKDSNMCRRVLCGHRWTEAGRTFECAEPVGPDGGHQGEHYAYVREGSAADEELRMRYLEEENASLRERLGLPPNKPRA